MRNYITLKCNYCNNDYIAREDQKERSKFCSRSCIGKSLAGKERKPKGEAIIKNCLYCDEKFKVKYSRIETAKYCSRLCATRASFKQKKINCKVCNKEFEVINARMNTAKYCSHSCRLIYRRTGFKEIRECLFCNKKFETQKARKKKHCSIQCFNKQKIKDGAPSFAAVRANMKKAGEITHCERCNYNEHPNILGLHHKDRDRKNNHRNNLEVLCPNCHSIEHMVHVCHGFKE